MSAVTITTLVENTATFGYLGEWGLSMLVSLEGHSFLYDTGMGKTIIHNAEMLKADLRKVSAIILSHGHVDHTGGLSRVLSRYGQKPVLAHPEIWQPKWSVRSDQSVRDIGMPFSKVDLEEMGAVFTDITEPTMIFDNVFLSGEVPLVTDFERVDKGLFSGAEEDRSPDEMPDDLSMAIKTSQGLVILLGCAHRGPINTIRHLIAVTGETRVHAVVGGLHLGHASDRRIDKTIESLEEIGIDILACSHCTGFRAMVRLAEAFPRKVVNNNAGSVLSLV